MLQQHECPLIYLSCFFVVVFFFLFLQVCKVGGVKRENNRNVSQPRPTTTNKNTTKTLCSCCKVMCFIKFTLVKRERERERGEGRGERRKRVSVTLSLVVLSLGEKNTGRRNLFLLCLSSVSTIPIRRKIGGAEIP